MTHHAAGAHADGGLRLTTLDGRYHVLDRIAAGGMGEVFRARDAVLDRQVAIKVLHRSLAGDQGFVERFRREARAAASLSHPHIVAVHDWGAVDGIYYMVMEYVNGRAVRDLLSAQGRLAPAQVADVLRQTLLALEHAHRQGIVHRDVKPENILVTTDGEVKVADFGLARAYADGRQTQAGTVTGTVQYLAPEQIRGEPADPRSDLYSLGIVGFELLTGRLPFTGETAMAIAYKHLSDRVPRPSALVPDMPADIDAFVASATERDRELRPESAAEMRRDLVAIARELASAPTLEDLVADVTPVVVRPPDGEAPDASTTTVTIRAERGGRRRLRRFLGAVLVIAALAAAAWGAWTYLLPHRNPVPAFGDTSVENARAELEDAGFAVKIARGRYSLKVPDDHVLSVQPAPGTTLEEGTVVTLTPSLGAEPLPVPRLAGEPSERARRALVEAGFRLGQTARRPSERVPEGRVIATKPGGGATALEQSRVALILSEGPPPRPVAPVVGSDVADARGDLSALGFAVTVVESFSDRVPVGRVISQEPGGNVERPYGSGVTLTVSKGPRAFPVGTYIGLTKDAAIAQIEADGLVARASSVPGGVTNHVVGQDPDPGTTVHPGDKIIIFVA